MEEWRQYPEGWKQCSVCGEWKPVSEYYRHQRDKTKYRSACKYCMRLKQKKVDDGRRTNEAKALARAERFAKMVRLVACPPDLTMGLSLYQPGVIFERSDFGSTLDLGRWPNGSVWEFICNEENRPAQWAVHGASMREVNGTRIIGPEEFC